MARELKIWNGRGDYDKLDGRLYICAATKKRAVELVNQAGYRCGSFNLRELNGYFAPCWDNAMEALVPVREEGVWFAKNDKAGHEGKIVRLI